MPTLWSALWLRGTRCKLAFLRTLVRLHHWRKNSLAYCIPYTFRVCSLTDHYNSGMVPLLSVRGVQSDGYSISAPWLVLMYHLSPNSPIPGFRTEETVQRNVRNIQQIPRLS